MNYYARHIGDYHKKAGRLTMLQHGAYTLLMDAIYDREKFPSLTDAIDWVWASSQPEVDAITFVLSKFFTLENGVYVQGRMQEELQHYRGLCETNKINGKLGGRPKKTTDSKPEETQPLNFETQSVNLETESKPNESEANPNQEPRTNNHKPIDKPIPSKYKYNDDQFQLAVELSNPVKQRFPTQDINLEKWAEDCRKLMEINKYSRDDIYFLWQWRTDHQGNNNFSWANNCRTPGKLREKKDGLTYFEIMKNQMSGECKNGNNQSGYGQSRASHRQDIADATHGASASDWATMEHQSGESG